MGTRNQAQKLLLEVKAQRATLELERNPEQQVELELELEVVVE